MRLRKGADWILRSIGLNRNMPSVEAQFMIRVAREIPYSSAVKPQMMEFGRHLKQALALAVDKGYRCFGFSAGLNHVRTERNDR